VKSSLNRWWRSWRNLLESNVAYVSKSLSHYVEEGKYLLSASKESFSISRSGNIEEKAGVWPESDIESIKCEMQSQYQLAAWQWPEEEKVISAV